MSIHKTYYFEYLVRFSSDIVLQYKASEIWTTNDFHGGLGGWNSGIKSYNEQIDDSNDQDI